MSVKKSGLGRKVLAAVSDQGLLSLVNFVVSIAFIRLGSKSEYGLYVLLLGPIYLAQGLQNALFLSPFATRVGGGMAARKDAPFAVLFWGQLIFLSVVCLVGAVGVGVYGRIQAVDNCDKLALFFAVAIAGWLVREWARSQQYVKGNMAAAFRGNILYAGAIVSYLSYGVFVGSIALNWLFAAIGVGGALAIGTRGTRLPTREGFIGEFREFWQLGRWALIGVVLTWANSNFYPYVVAEKFGVETVGEVNAARLFVMPFVLLLPAWSNLFRPMFSRWFAEGRRREMGNVTRMSAGAGSLTIALYGILISCGYEYFEWILGKGYEGLGVLIGGWCFYYLLFFLRTVYQATMMIDETGYRRLSKISFFLFILLWPILLVAPRFGPFGIIIGLAVLEFFQFLYIRYWARRYWNDVGNARL